MPSAPPTVTPRLKTWSANFAAKLSATPTVVGCTASDATSYAGLNTDFQARSATVENPATNTKVTREQLATSKAALLLKARALCKVINAYPGTTDALRADFGLNPRDVTPTPAPVPTTRPQLSVDPFGNVRLVDEATPTRRGKPTGVFAAVVLYKLGTTADPAPASTDDGRLAGVATRGKFAIPLPPDATGKTLWAFAQWINDRGEAGPLGAPVRTLVAA